MRDFLSVWYVGLMFIKMIAYVDPNTISIDCLYIHQYLPSNDNICASDDSGTCHRGLPENS